MTSPSSTVYCYHCRSQHPREDMRQIASKSGTRWRCVYSIEAAKADKETREAFGRKVSENNKADARANLRIKQSAKTKIE